MLLWKKKQIYLYRFPNHSETITESFKRKMNEMEPFWSAEALGEDVVLHWYVTPPLVLL